MPPRAGRARRDGRQVVDVKDERAGSGARPGGRVTVREVLEVGGQAMVRTSTPKGLVAPARPTNAPRKEVVLSRASAARALGE